MNQRRNSPARTFARWAARIAAGVLAAYFVALIVFPSVLKLWPNGEFANWWRSVGATDWYEETLVASVGVFSLLWFFALGACIASFINVVAWRIPRGRSILGSSHCPYCNTRLALRDNLPVIGWINLKGRCRYCRLPISPRYLCVEVLLGGIFLLLMLVELATAGFNLPNYESEAPAGIAAALMMTDPQTWLIYLYHAALFAILLTVLLIEHDRLQVPWSIVVFAFVVMGLYAVIFPEVQIDSPRSQSGSGVLINRIASPLIGCAMGVLAGLGWLAAVRHQSRTWQFMPPEVFALGITGLSLGWQAVIGITAIGLALRFLVIPVVRRFGPRPVLFGSLEFIMLAALMHVFLWKPLDRWSFWPGSNTTGIGWIFIVVAIALLVIGNRFVSREQTGTRSSIDLGAGKSA